MLHTLRWGPMRMYMLAEIYIHSQSKRRTARAA